MLLAVWKVPAVIPGLDTTAHESDFAATADAPNCFTTFAMTAATAAVTAGNVAAWQSDIHFGSDRFPRYMRRCSRAIDFPVARPAAAEAEILPVCRRLLQAREVVPPALHGHKALSRKVRAGGRVRR